jgi:predicted phage replisome organizer
MADNKKYYYMRLKEDFFNSEEIILLESMPDGHLYSNILLKMYLCSLKNDGRMMLNNIIPYNAQMIATVTRHQVGTVEKALDIFEKLGLIEKLDNGAIYMLNIQSYIGKSSTEAERIRDYRNKIKEEKTNGVQMYNKRTPEIDIDIDLEKETKKEKEKKKKEKNKQASMEADELFEKLWKLYPKKEGKGSVKDTQKKILLKIGYDEMVRCIERYKKAKEGVDKKYIKMGSTFFNSGYVDYLDKNYETQDNDYSPMPTEIKTYRQMAESGERQ